MLPAPAPVEEPPAQPSHLEHPGGLVLDLVRPGRRVAAQVGDRLRLHYDVRLKDGAEVLETTRSGGVPHAYTLGRGELIRGLERGLIGVWEGAAVTLLVPAALAYGEKGLGRIPPNEDLLFDIELVSVERP